MKSLINIASIAFGSKVAGEVEFNSMIRTLTRLLVVAIVGIVVIAVRCM